MKKAEIKRRFAVLTSVGIVAGFALFAFCGKSSLAQPSQDFGWGNIPALSLAGDLKAYWNVIDGSKGEAAKNAYARGFEPVTVLNTYADFPRQRENITVAIGSHHVNPWQKPPFFERVIRRNIQQAVPNGIYVHDIEFPFEEDTKLAWEDGAARRASGVQSREAFDEAYFKQWAQWFWLPLKWTKESYPTTRVGLYGVQPFHRSISPTAAQNDGTHNSDWRLWKYIDSYVDFYVASIYLFYDQPDAVLYMATNVEENYLRTRSVGDKPVYAYEWLRFHGANNALKGKELPSYLVEAMAIVPYFSGAKGVVLWGYEPQVKTGTQQPYEQLPLFVRSLNRVAMLSEKLSRGQLLIDRPAHEVWKAHGPLIRKVMVDEDECIVMAISPWQSDDKRTTYPVQCGQLSAQISIDGRHTTLAVINRRGLQIY
ncbi:hypothetical protein NMG46_28440 [Mesorhizobium sp. LMG 17147]|uniref:hypothetical protein n=1 Tax=Mesorhizobium sp. LMG 17147 TaxID=2963091 RepID=UPI0020C9BCA1|nr:hypothetical protein [Mesorhizobium sp. LMG 17147]MCP9234084.1 hypothetical protein [Mesorhizobium sp. LMG 17147]